MSGAILYEETLYQNHANGTPFVNCLNSVGVFPGIKVDTGLQPLPGADPIETWYLSFITCDVRHVQLELHTGALA